MSVHVRDDAWVRNENAVEGYVETSGNYYGHKLADGTWRVNVPIFVPRCCAECSNFDPGEYGDYGSKLSGPYCERNVWFPTRRGTCAWQNKRI